MVDLKETNRLLDVLMATVDSPEPVAEGAELYCGLDVGTAFIVLVVVDAAGEPRRLRLPVRRCRPRRHGGRLHGRLRHRPLP